MRWLTPFMFVLLLATGCAADAGGKSAAERGIADTLVRVFEADDPRAAAAGRGLEITSHGIRVDVQTQGLEAAHRERFDLPGVHVHHFSPRHERVAVSVGDLEALRSLARIEVVRRLAPAYGTKDDGVKGGVY